MVRISHRQTFNPADVKNMLGIATDKLAKYKDMAAFLGSKQAKHESVIEYFERIFPLTTTKEQVEGIKKLSKNASLALNVIDTQPGSEYAQGSWWQPYNAVTFMTDHIIGRNDDSRLASAWYRSEEHTSELQSH